MDRKLIEYLPPVIREIAEIKAITAAQQPEIEKLWQAVKDTEDDQFIVDASMNGISRWEKILDIKPKGTDDLDSRRFRIKTRLNEELPFTVPRLEEMLGALCGEKGYQMCMESGDYILHVKINLTAKSNYDDVADLLLRVNPENMVIDLSLLYNTHQVLEEFTHEELERYTHAELEDEVITHAE